MHRLRRNIILIMSVALFGEIYFYPFNSPLRFSAGIIALNLIILIMDDIDQFSISFFSGIAVFILRTLIKISFTSLPFEEIIRLNVPSIGYYLIYGLSIIIVDIRKHREKFLIPIISLSIIDALSNIFEATIRNQGITLSMIQIIVLAGLARGIIAYFIYLLYKKQELFILNREHQKRYSQLNILVANIQAEMFYLKKSTHDIENVMSKSYGLYNKYKEDKYIKEETLDIAREIHEIKKDYYRVLSGFENFLKTFENNGSMTLKHMLVIIRENTLRFVKENNREIHIAFDFLDDFTLKKYYNLFTIMNNLIINAIDACGDHGTILVSEKSNHDSIIFHVKDDGEGIHEEMIPLIFNPGFTTKYDPVTGNPSTGIGLSHVKNIIEELDGSIKVTSHLNQGTTMTVVLPKKTLIG